MSKYTSEIRFICESLYKMEYSNAKNVDEVISKVYNKIFDFSYPIFDTNYKKILETHILKHFYTREISEETFGLWKLRLNQKMNDIMPLYNQFYLSELKEIDPLSTHGLKREYVKNGEVNDNTTGVGHIYTERAGNNSSNAQTNGNEKIKDRYSDTPQGGLENIENNTYLTNAEINEKKSSTQSIKGDTINENSTTDSNERQNKEINSVEDYIEKVTGYDGISLPELLMKWRDSFVNVDMMVINELEPLFFGLW